MKKIGLVILASILLLVPSVQSVLFNYSDPTQIEPGSSTTIYLTTFGGSVDDYYLLFTPEVEIVSKSIDGDQMVITVSASDLGTYDLSVTHLPSDQEYTFLGVFEVIDPTSTNTDYPTDTKEYEIDVMSSLEEEILIFDVSAQERSSVYIRIGESIYQTVEDGREYVSVVYFNEVGVKEGDIVSYTLLINDDEYYYTYRIPESIYVNPIVLPESSFVYSEKPENRLQSELLSFIYYVFLLFSMQAIVAPGSVSSTNNVVTYNVTIPNESIYNDTVYDYHIMFNGTVKSCKLKIPPWPVGWRCEIRGKIIEVYNEIGDPLPIGTTEGIEIETDPPNAAILDYWATTNTTNQPIKPGTGEAIIMGDNWGPITFTDCDDYCPGKTNDQFKRELEEYVRDACQKFKNALKVVESELDRIQTGNAAEKIKMRQIKSNRERLANILKGALRKCKKGVLIECDSSYNYQCWDGDTNAFVPKPLSTTSDSFNLHLCPAFCKINDPGDTIMHELTHFGGSVDDVNDDINAHNLELIIPFLDMVCKRESNAYQ